MSNEPSSKEEPEDGRLDKWLWTVRVFKLRTLAAKACKAGRVEVNGRVAKAAQTLRAGSVVEVRQGGLTRRLVVLGLPRGRQGAAKVAEFMRDETPPEMVARAAENRVHQAQAGGAGKPAGKRDRRVLRALREKG